MSNNLPVHLQNAITAMEQVATKIDTASGDFDYLKLTKAGEWVHGADDVEVSEGSLFAIDTQSFCMGFQAWEDGNLEGEEIALFTEGQILRSDLPDVGAEWKPLLGFKLLCIEGADEGLQLIYKTTSKGGIKEVNALMKAIVAQAKNPNNDGKITPVVELLTDSYRHKKYGKIYTPIIDPVDWITEDHNFAEQAEPQKEPEPQVEEVEEVVEEPQPVRRRRRG